MASPDFPLRKALTGNFRHGQPRAAAVFGDAAAWRVRYLASDGPEDGVLALRETDSGGGSRVLADPRHLLADPEDLPPAERARRERLREGGAGITAFSSDEAGLRSCFALSGELWLVDPAGPRALPSAGAVVDPRLSPDGTRIAYHSAGALRLMDVATGLDRPLCEPAHADEAWGLAEFIAAEEMGRMRGFWWSPASDALLVCQTDEALVGTWWISDPADPAAEPRPIRYPAAGTANAVVRLWRVGLDGTRTEVEWDRAALPYLAAVRWDAAGAVCSVQSRDQRTVRHLRIDDAGTTEIALQQREPWVELVPGSPRLAGDGSLLLVDVDPDSDCWRLRRAGDWLTPVGWQVRALLQVSADGIWVSASTDGREQHLLEVLPDGSVRQLTPDGGWHVPLAAGPVPVVALAGGGWQPRFSVGDPRRPVALLPNPAAAPEGEPRVTFLAPTGTGGEVRVAVILPDDTAPAPVIVSSYGGPHAQRVIRNPLAFATEQWFSDRGYAVVVIDGRGSPGVAPSCEAAIAGDLAGPPLADQIAGLRAAAAAHPGRLDTSRVGIRGWSFGGYLSALAVLEAPEVFHAAFAGAPVTEWRLYDTHYTERYLGAPQDSPQAYDASSLLPLAPQLARPLCLVHGMADDNVVAAHTLQLSAALTAAGRPHEVLPLPGVSHMTPQQTVTEQLLRLELAFFDRHLR